MVNQKRNEQNHQVVNRIQKCLKSYFWIFRFATNFNCVTQKKRSQYNRRNQIDDATHACQIWQQSDNKQKNCV